MCYRTAADEREEMLRLVDANCWNWCSTRAISREAPRPHNLLYNANQLLSYSEGKHVYVCLQTLAKADEF